MCRTVGPTSPEKETVSGLLRGGSEDGLPLLIPIHATSYYCQIPCQHLSLLFFFLFLFPYLFPYLCLCLCLSTCSRAPSFIIPTLLVPF